MAYIKRVPLFFLPIILCSFVTLLSCSQNGTPAESRERDAAIVETTEQETVLEETALFSQTAADKNISEPVRRQVRIIIDGEEQIIETTAVVVSNVLQEAGITPGENYRVIPKPEDTFEDTIKVIRVEQKTVSEQKQIPFATEEKTDSNLLKGETRIIQKGVNGMEKYVYDLVLEDGEITEKKLVEQKVVREPVKQVVALGTRKTVSRSGQEIKFQKVLTMTATGYTHTGNKTYTGVWPSRGTVAVDPKVIPIGKRLYIDGYGYARAMDVGGDIRANRIDLFFETKEEAMKWGRRKVQVFILEQE